MFQHHYLSFLGLKLNKYHYFTPTITIHNLKRVCILIRLFSALRVYLKKYYMLIFNWKKVLSGLNMLKKRERYQKTIMSTGLYLYAKLSGAVCWSGRSDV